MAKRIGPEAKIISLFTALPEDSKRIVFDILKGQMATPRKVGVKKVKEPPKLARVLPEKPEDFKHEAAG